MNIEAIQYLMMGFFPLYFQTHKKLTVFLTGIFKQTVSHNELSGKVKTLNTYPRTQRDMKHISDGLIPYAITEQLPPYVADALTYSMASSQV